MTLLGRVVTSLALAMTALMLFAFLGEPVPIMMEPVIEVPDGVRRMIRTLQMRETVCEHLSLTGHVRAVREGKVRSLWPTPKA